MARRISPRVPGAFSIPSWGKATICRSIRPAYSRRSSASTSTPRVPTIGSTSGWARIRVVPCAMAASSTRRARSAIPSWSKSALRRPVTAMAPASVPSGLGSSESRWALSRCRWVSTKPGSTSRPARLRPSSPSAGAPPVAGTMSVMRPSARVRSTRSSDSRVRALLRRIPSTQPMACFVPVTPSCPWRYMRDICPQALVSWGDPSGTYPAAVSTPPPAHPRQKFTDDGRRMREVLSYSRRGGRFTPSQQESWDAHHEDWVVPDAAVDDPSFSWSGVLGRTAPIIVEIGSGVGEATAALAAARPSYDVVALEVWRPGVAHTLGLIAEAGADNVRLLSVDAVWVLRHLFGTGEVDELWTFFPDPWPKTRHHKRRLVTAEFVRLAASRLRPGGMWRLATDWADYAEQMCAVLDADPAFEGGPVP